MSFHPLRNPCVDYRKAPGNRCVLVGLTGGLVSCFPSWPQRHNSIYHGAPIMGHCCHTRTVAQILFNCDLLVASGMCVPCIQSLSSCGRVSALPLEQRAARGRPQVHIVLTCTELGFAASKDAYLLSSRDQRQCRMSTSIDAFRRANGIDLDKPGESDSLVHVSSYWSSSDRIREAFHVLQGGSFGESKMKTD